MHANQQNGRNSNPRIGKDSETQSDGATEIAFKHLENEMQNKAAINQKLSTCQETSTAIILFQGKQNGGPHAAILS